MKRTLVALCVVGAMFTRAQAARGEAHERPVVAKPCSNIPYDFPVLPGQPGWSKLKSMGEMLEATTVPQDHLDGMCTEALLVTCMRYPFNLSFTSFNSHQRGFETITSRSNAYVALLRRADAWAEVLREYRKLDLTPKALTESDSGIASWKSQWLELLLSQPELLMSAGPAGRIQILKTALAKWDERQTRSLSTHMTSVLMTRIISSSDPSFLSGRADSEFLIHAVAEAGKITDEDQATILAAARRFAGADPKGGR